MNMGDVATYEFPLKDSPSYGLMAEFADPTDLVEAARRAREEGFTKLDAYSPYPIEALTEAKNAALAQAHLNASQGGSRVNPLETVARGDQHRL